MRGRRFFWGGRVRGYLLEVIGEEGMLSIEVEDHEEATSSKGSAGVSPAVSRILRGTSLCGRSVPLHVLSIS